MTLRLVRDEPPKPPMRRKKWQPPPPVLTPEEETRFRAAMRNLQGAFGSWPCLAKAMGVKPKSVTSMMRGRCHVSGEMIVRAMKASGIRSLDELLGGPVAADRCRACGRVRAA